VHADLVGRVSAHKLFSQLRADIALLRIAYLAMFREFGYRYILSPAASVIREIINSFDQCPMGIGKFIGQVRGGEPERFGKSLQLLKIQGGIAIMVVMTLVTETKRYNAALMPSPELPPKSVIATLCGAAKSVSGQPFVSHAEADFRVHHPQRGSKSMPTGS
jgi:hypothetical protein